MNPNDSDRTVIEGLFAAMQAGAAGEADMMALFAEDAVFIEPFSGEPKSHSGKAAIRISYRQMWEQPAPETDLILDRVDVDNDQLRAEWTCTSPAFATPMRGYDLFTIRQGKILRLEVIVTEMPPMEG